MLVSHASLSIHQLFFMCGGRKLCGQKYEWDCWILRMKQLRNRETAKPSVPVLTSQPYYPQSPILQGIVLAHVQWASRFLKVTSQATLDSVQQRSNNPVEWIIKTKMTISFSIIANFNVMGKLLACFFWNMLFWQLIIIIIIIIIIICSNTNRTTWACVLLFLQLRHYNSKRIIR